MLAQHQSKSQEHYTPDFILDATRSLLGGIDLDPASSHIANQRVKAKQYFTKEDDALNCRWWGNVFLNPPGGRGKGIKSYTKAFWNKLVWEYLTGHVDEAIFLAFSIELLQTSQNGEDDPRFWATSYPICIPRKRVSFIDSTGNPQTSPPHASAIIYLPSYSRHVSAHNNFKVCFSHIGAVMGL
jgi:hypothetical protein